MTPSLLRRAAGALALTAVLSSALTACGGDDEQPTGGSGTSAPTGLSSSNPASTETSSTETSATPTPTPTRESSGPTELSVADFAAIADRALDVTSAAHLVIDSELGYLSGEGDVDFRDTPSSLQMKLMSSESGDGAQPITIRIVGNTMYLQDRKGFLAIDIDSPDNPFGSSLSRQLDPRTVLRTVQENVTEVIGTGTVEQDGETLEVYRAIADGPSLVQKLAPDLAAQTGVVVPPTVSCDLTVDADGRARTIVVDLGQENGRLSYSLDGWRTDVSIEAPPPGQVSELPPLPNR